jgi:arginyl-tRNA synthetase
MADRDIVEIYKDQLAEQIAQAALRFTILRGDIYRDVVFDFDQALSFEGDSGPYLQYSVVRLRAVLERAHGLEITQDLEAVRDEDRELLRLLHQLPNVVSTSAINHAPQNLVVYLLQLAQASNSYYATNKIVDESDHETSAHRLAIVTAVANAIECGLNILGITVPSEM